jgi:hypothetical protein
MEATTEAVNLAATSFTVSGNENIDLKVIFKILPFGSTIGANNVNYLKKCDLMPFLFKKIGKHFGALLIHYTPDDVDPVV